MKKISKNDADMLPDYDFSGGVRGKYAKRYAQGTNIILLDPDVAKIFPSAEIVNSSLRGLAEILKLQKKVSKKALHSTAITRTA